MFGFPAQFFGWLPGNWNTSDTHVQKTYLIVFPGHPDYEPVKATVISADGRVTSVRTQKATECVCLGLIDL